MPQLSDRYYSGREVQRKLGITEPALRNLVNQRRIRKVTPPGRQYGIYLKEEIDTFAEKWLAFLTAKEPPKTTLEPATTEDMEAEQELAKRAIRSPGLMTTEIRKAWLTKNPEGHYLLKHNNKLVAYLWLLPVMHERLMEFMDGKIRGGEIRAEDVDAFEPGKPVECFVVGLASEPDVGETTRMHYVQHLVRGVMKELEKLGRKGYIITKIYATSDTPTGIATAIHIGMEEYGEKIGKRLKFVLDVEKSTSFLLDDYKQGLAEWRKEQKKQATSKKKSNKNNTASSPVSEREAASKSSV